MKKLLTSYLLDVLSMFLWALNLSCGVNLQQYGYRFHSNFLNVLGIALIAISIVGIKRTRLYSELPATSSSPERGPK